MVDYYCVKGIGNIDFYFNNEISYVFYELKNLGMYVF